MSLTAVTVTTLREKLKSYLDRVSKSMETLIVSRGDESDTVVIMSLDTYNSLTETNYLLSDPANRARLLASLQEAKTGRTVVKSLDDIDRLIVKKKRQQKHEGRVH